jgi:large subunit ribosomal protein L13
VTIINAEKIVITGNPVSIVNDYKPIFFVIRNIAKPVHSPHVSKRPDLFVRRTIRGMLPRKTTRGAAALKRIRAYIGDNGMKGEKVFEFRNPNARHMTVLELCKALGWKG